MGKNTSLSIEKLKEISLYLNEVVVICDQIGSNFHDDELNDDKKMAAALLLFFNQRKILDKLSRTRKYIYQELENRLSTQEYDDWIEQDLYYWEPPYNKTEDDILSIIKNNDF